MDFKKIILQTALLSAVLLSLQLYILIDRAFCLEKDTYLNCDQLSPRLNIPASLIKKSCSLAQKNSSDTKFAFEKVNPKHAWKEIMSFATGDLSDEKELFIWDAPWIEDGEMSLFRLQADNKTIALITGDPMKPYSDELLIYAILVDIPWRNQGISSGMIMLLKKYFDIGSVGSIHGIFKHGKSTEDIVKNITDEKKKSPLSQIEVRNTHDLLEIAI